MFAKRDYIRSAERAGIWVDGWVLHYWVLRRIRVNLKARGLNITTETKNLGYLMTNDAQKEFCQYHGILYEESENGAVTTARAYVQGFMFKEFAKIATNNNWRKMHGLPLIRRKRK